MTRTYTLDADMCDLWVRVSCELDGTCRIPGDRELVDAIRAQQPKPWIGWDMGRTIRAIGPGPATWMMADQYGERLVVCVDHGGGGVPVGFVARPIDLAGYDPTKGFDPDLWELVAP